MFPVLGGWLDAPVWLLGLRAITAKAWPGWWVHPCIPPPRSGWR